MEGIDIPWVCPKCGAPHSSHGKGGADKCQYRLSGSEGCQGLLCDCDELDPGEEHGTNFKDPCHNAVCYHCGWYGVFPPMPKKLLAWEKKALEAGWTPPEGRRKEIGL